MPTLSGPSWVTHFPTSIAVADLAQPFQQNVARFLAALTEAGATYDIAATYRPPERAFLMHYAWCIVHENLHPAQVPARPDIPILWLHPNDPTLTQSRAAALAMIEAYDIVYKPALTSRHIERLAIDVSIAWQGALVIADGHGQTLTLSTLPRNGNNLDLHRVGASYGVHKLVDDPPHWSSDGR